MACGCTRAIRLARSAICSAATPPAAPAITVNAPVTARLRTTGLAWRRVTETIVAYDVTNRTLHLDRHAGVRRGPVRSGLRRSAGDQAER
jgi:hypothetical protein